MTTIPPITENQISMLRALLAKKGWSESYFAWKTNAALKELTTSQARSWISRLTKETKGKPRPTILLEPPETPIAVPPRRKAAPAAPVDTAASPALPGPDIEAAAATMMTQLGLVGEPARQTIVATLTQVGVRVGFAAVMLALAAKQQPGRLTPLEHFVAFCRQLNAGRE